MLKQIALGIVLLTGLLTLPAWADDVLYDAAYAGDKAKVEALLAKGANVNEMDHYYGRTPLLGAASAGKIEVVELLIAKGSDVNFKDESGYTPLHAAASDGNKEVVELLIARGANIHAREETNNWTPLHRAIYYQKKDAIEALIAHGAGVNDLISKGADVNVKDGNGMTALHYAAQSGNKAVVEALIAKGADIKAVDNKKTVLHFAAQSGNKALVEWLVGRGLDINADAGYGGFPLHYAALSGNKELVEWLVTKGADLKAKDKYDGSVLHYAAQSGNKALVEWLVVKGADVNAKSYHGAPLHLAAEKGHKDIVEFLASRGADLKAKGIYERSVLHYAARSGNKALAEWLVSKGADVKAKDESQVTVLHLAMYEHREFIEWLVKQGADVNAKDNSIYGIPLSQAASMGNKALMEFLMANGASLKANEGLVLCEAARSGNKELVEWLVGQGVSITAKNDSGQTALHTAASSGKKELAEWLVARGAEINARDNSGSTPLYLSVRLSKDVAELLLAKGADVNAADNNGDTPLHSAAIDDRKEVILLLIAKGADVNAKNKKGETPLFNAAYYRDGNMNTIEALISKKADVNAKDNEGKTPLVVALNKGHMNVVQALAAAGASVNTSDKDENTPLHEAARSGNKDIVELLLAKGADVNAKNKSKNTPLYNAAYHGKADVVELFLSRSQGNIEGKEEAILLALRYGLKEVVAVFLAHGMDVNARNKDGASPLHVAVNPYGIVKDAVGLIELLIAKGADINAKDNDGDTPLLAAVGSYSGAKKEIVELLLAKGADVNARTNKGFGDKTPLQVTEGIKDPKVRQEIIALLQGQMAKQSNPRQMLNSLLEQFKGYSDNDELRKSIIQAVLKMSPAPAIPQEAEDAAGRAAYIFKSAKSEDDMLATAKEFLKAVELAPWVANYYFNLCTVLEKTPYTQQALHACKLYLDAAPNAADAAEIRQRIAGLKFATEKNNEQIKQRTAYFGRQGHKELYRDGGISGQVAGKDVVVKLVVNWQASPPKYQIFSSCFEGDQVLGGPDDLVSTDTWFNLCGTSFHLIIKPDGAGYVELGGGGSLRTTLDELFQRKQKALAQSPIFKDYGYGDDKGIRFYVGYLHGGRDNNYAGYAMYESDCNGNLLRKDPRALPDDFVSQETMKKEGGTGRFNSLMDYQGKPQSGCNDKFSSVTGYKFGENE